MSKENDKIYFYRVSFFPEICSDQILSYLELKTSDKFLYRERYDLGTLRKTHHCSFLHVNYPIT